MMKKKMKKVKQSPTKAIPPPSSPAAPIILNTHSHDVNEDGDYFHNNEEDDEGEEDDNDVEDDNDYDENDVDKVG